MHTPTYSTPTFITEALRIVTYVAIIAALSYCRSEFMAIWLYAYNRLLYACGNS